jgi:urease
VFDHWLALGRRLNVPSGASVRFEPSERKTVTLVQLVGRRHVACGNNLTDGVADAARWDKIAGRLEAVPNAFGHKAVGAEVTEGRPHVFSRAEYADTYGPIAGDRVRLGTTAPVARVERDHTRYGNACKFGGGKSLRKGMGQMTKVFAYLALDCVITNTLIVDAVMEIVKADIRIKGNLIHNVGKAGNPDTMDKVTLTPGMEIIVSPTTDVIAGKKMIVTAGGVDTHIHFICRQQVRSVAEAV